MIVEYKHVNSDNQDFWEEYSAVYDTEEEAKADYDAWINRDEKGYGTIVATLYKGEITHSNA